MSEKETKEQINEAKVDVREIIKTLGETDWGSDNEAQGKAVQLLRGLAFSEDPLSNKFMKQLSDASTVLANNLLKENVQENHDAKTIDSANTFLM